LGPSFPWLLTDQSHTPARSGTDTTGSIAGLLDAMRGKLLGCSKRLLDTNAAGLSERKMWCLCLRAALDSCFSKHV